MGFRAQHSGARGIRAATVPESPPPARPTISALINLAPTRVLNSRQRVQGQWIRATWPDRGAWSGWRSPIAGGYVAPHVRRSPSPTCPRVPPLTRGQRAREPATHKPPRGPPRCMHQPARHRGPRRVSPRISGHHVSPEPCPCTSAILYGPRRVCRLISGGHVASGRSTTSPMNQNAQKTFGCPF